MDNDKAVGLKIIADQVRSLTESPLYEYRQQNNYSAVIGEGDPDAAIMFIGEAPGEQEAKSGRPFVGAAGKVLDELIEQVQITVAETVGVEHRGGYYDRTGALRDMIQNHLLQLLCLIAMEPPVSFAADEIRSKKEAVLQSIRSFPPGEVSRVAARGQYQAGEIEGQPVMKPAPGGRKQPSS